MKTYRADYEDESFVIIISENDDKALSIAFNFENEHGFLFNLTLLDDDFVDLEIVF